MLITLHIAPGEKAPDSLDLTPQILFWEGNRIPDDDPVFEEVNRYSPMSGGTIKITKTVFKVWEMPFAKLKDFCDAAHYSLAEAEKKAGASGAFTWSVMIEHETSEPEIIDDQDPRWEEIMAKVKTVRDVIKNDIETQKS